MECDGFGWARADILLVPGIGLYFGLVLNTELMVQRCFGYC